MSQRENVRPPPPPPLWKGGWDVVEHKDIKLVNLGATCYLNSILQGLFHLSPFVEWLVSSQHTCQSTVCLQCSIRRFFVEAAKFSTFAHRPATVIAVLRVVLPDKKINLGKQEDAHEIFASIVNFLNEEYIRTAGGKRMTDLEISKSPLGSILGGRILNTCMCSACGFCSSSTEFFNHVTLSISDDGIISVDAALKDYFSEEKIEYTCRKCGNKKNNGKSYKMLHPPQVLAINLKRFHPLTHQKIVKKVLINSHLDVNGTAYTFSSCIVHEGPRKTEGHYFTVCKCPNGYYTVLNDDKEIKRYNHMPFMCVSDAYLIFYERVKRSGQTASFCSTPIKNTTALMKADAEIWATLGGFEVSPIKMPQINTETDQKKSTVKAVYPIIMPRIGTETDQKKSPEKAVPPIKTAGIETKTDQKSPEKAVPPIKTAGIKTKTDQKSPEKALPPIKIIREIRKRPKSSSSQSDHDYHIKRQKLDVELKSPVTEEKEVNGFAVAPLKIVWKNRGRPKSSSSQSEHDYFLKHQQLNVQKESAATQKTTAKCKVSPLKIMRQNRNKPKSSSSQSAHDYFIKDQLLHLNQESQIQGQECRKNDFQISPRKVAQQSTSSPKDQPSPDVSLEPSKSNPLPPVQSPGLHEGSAGCNDSNLNISGKEVLMVDLNAVINTVLLPSEVPGAVLPKKIIVDNQMKDLQRWLECYGFPITGRKDDLVERVKDVIALGSNKEVIPSIDNGIWLAAKLSEANALVPSSQQARVIFPRSGWKPFPSFQIPLNFNFGHIFYFLVESMPHLNDINDEDCEVPQAGEGWIDPSPVEKQAVIHHKRFRRGLKYIKSRFVGDVKDNHRGSEYFVQCQVRASMDMDLHTVEVALSDVSGSVKATTCDCKQHALGRCAHVSATLLYIWEHIKLNGYEAVACTSRPCEWNQGKLQRDPGNIKEKTYPAYKIDCRRRQTFDPRATKYRITEMTRTHIEHFLANLSGNKEKTRWQYHLPKIIYEDFTMDQKHKRRLAMLCRKFLKNQKEAVCVDDSMVEIDPEAEVPYEELEEGVLYEIKVTQGQGEGENKDFWHGRRSVIIGASVSKKVCHITEKGVKGFLKSHLWGKFKTKTEAMTYGTDMEPLAAVAYIDKRFLTDPTAALYNGYGIHINGSFPAVGCSPDGLVYSEMHEVILLEIKCPFILKDADPNNFESVLSADQLKRFPVERDTAGTLKIKKGHEFNYQIQQSLAILKLKLAHLAVYSKHGLLVVEVPFDPIMWDEIHQLTTKFQREYLIPEYFEMRVPRDLEPICLKY